MNRLISRRCAISVCATAALLAGCGGPQSGFNPSDQAGNWSSPARVAAPQIVREKPIYSFLGGPDGSAPEAGLMADATGTLYGTTSQGGGSNSAGTVFRLTSVGKRYKKTTLYTFLGFSDGQDPLGALIEDGSGALYGTTYNGGINNATGTVFKLTPAGSGYTKTTIYTFQGGSDGANPDGPLLADKSGALYGTTTAGGTSGDGTVFKLTPAGSAYTEQILYSFKGGQDGATPRTALLMHDRVLYSTTLVGGGGPCALVGSPTGCGTVFALKPSHGRYEETVLYRFQGKKDGAYVYGGLAMDSRGALYGTTGDGGGDFRCRGGHGFKGCGTIFKLTRSGSGYAETILHRFTGLDGLGPVAGLTPASGGRFYGTTLLGGTKNQGTAFVLMPVGRGYKLIVRHNFQQNSENDGAGPSCTLIFGADGELFGTTEAGGVANNGTVFRLTP